MNNSDIIWWLLAIIITSFFVPWKKFFDKKEVTVNTQLSGSEKKQEPTQQDQNVQNATVKDTSSVSGKTPPKPEKPKGDWKLVKNLAAAWFIAGIVYVIGLTAWNIGKAVYDIVNGEKATINVASRPTSTNPWAKYHFTKDQIPADEAFAVIGSCESTGAPGNTPVHWKKGEEGKTPLPNNQGSGAFGWLQLTPDKIQDAKNKGFGDIVRDKANYDRYAKSLYENKGSMEGTSHWEFVTKDGKGGPACWGETLMAIAIKRGTSRPDEAGNPLEETLKIVKAGEGIWSDPVNVLSTPGKWVFWDPTVKGQIDCQVRINRNEEFVRDCRDENLKLPPGEYIRSLEFASEGGPDFMMKVFLRQAPK